MTRNRSPNRDKALKIYIMNKGDISMKEIAKKINETVSNLYNWKKVDKWDQYIKIKNDIGAVEGNLSGLKHGANINYEKRINDKNFLKKYVSVKTNKILEDIRSSELTALDILWDNITLKYAAIITSQKILEVKNKKEFNYFENQERFLKAQAVAMNVLNNMIKNYQELLNKNYDLVNEEQKLRVEKLRLEITTYQNKNDINININSTKKLDSILEVLNDE